MILHNQGIYKRNRLENKRNSTDTLDGIYISIHVSMLSSVSYCSLSVHKGKINATIGSLI